MTHYINLREHDLYPLLRMENGYFCSRSAVGTDEIAEVESGNQPLSHARSGNLKNQEAQEDINHFCNPQTYDESYWGCPATGHPCPKKEGDK